MVAEEGIQKKWSMWSQVLFGDSFDLTPFSDHLTLLVCLQAKEKLPSRIDKAQKLHLQGEVKQERTRAQLPDSNLTEQKVQNVSSA